MFRKPAPRDPARVKDPVADFPAGDNVENGSLSPHPPVPFPRPSSCHMKNANTKLLRRFAHFWFRCCAAVSFLLRQQEFFRSLQV